MGHSIGYIGNKYPRLTYLGSKGKKKVQKYSSNKKKRYFCLKICENLMNYY